MKQKRFYTVTHSKFIASSAACITMCILPYFAFAVGLGDIRQSSALGQPLSAEVSLINVSKELNNANLKARQITKSEAKELGVELISNWQPVNVTLDGEKIHLKTRTAVKEPYIDMLIELSWPQGKVYREYTLLLDPPEIANKAISRKKNTRLDSPILPKPKRQSIASNKSKTTTKKINEHLASSIESRNYRISTGDTLNNIATRVAKSAKLSKAQAAQWIYMNNPEAFIKGNRNRITAGTTLKMPIGINIAKSSSNTAETKMGMLKLAQPASNQAWTQSSQEIIAPSRHSETIIEELIKKNKAFMDRISFLRNSEYLITMENIVERQKRRITALKHHIIALNEQAFSASAANVKKDDISIAWVPLFNGNNQNATPKHTMIWGVIISAIITALALFGTALRYLDRFRSHPLFINGDVNPNKDNAQELTEQFKPLTDTTQPEIHNHKIAGLPVEEQVKIYTIKNKIKEKVNIYDVHAPQASNDICHVETIEIDEDLEKYLKL